MRWSVEDAHARLCDCDKPPLLEGGEEEDPLGLCWFVLVWLWVWGLGLVWGLGVVWIVWLGCLGWLVRWKTRTQERTHFVTDEGAHQYHTNQQHMTVFTSSMLIQNSSGLISKQITLMLQHGQTSAGTLKTCLPTSQKTTALRWLLASHKNSWFRRSQRNRRAGSKR